MYKNGYMTDKEFDKEQGAIRNALIENDNNIQQIKNFIEKYKDVNVYDILKAGMNETDFNTKYDYIQKYVDKIVIYDVKVLSDEARSHFKHWGKSDKIRQSKDMDRIKYIELFAFNNPKPIRICMTSWTNLYYVDITSQRMNFDIMKYDINNKELTIDTSELKKIISKGIKR
jgi:hypothetical protein